MSTTDLAVPKQEGILEQASVRSLTNQLADDLSWLEEHARRQPEHAIAAGELHLASALVRNVIAPYLEGFPPQPLHVAVVGGAGAGKSTVANLLSGAMHAESNPQAGFTRHPVAYASSYGALNWPSSLGFMGTLRRLSGQEPSSLDADVYQVRRVSYQAEQFSVLDPPSLPQKPYWPNTLQLSMAGLAGGMFAAMAVIILKEASDPRIRSEEEMRVWTGIKVIALIPPLSTPAEVKRQSRKRSIEIAAGSLMAVLVPAVTLTVHLKH